MATMQDLYNLLIFEQPIEKKFLSELKQESDKFKRQQDFLQKSNIVREIAIKLEEQEINIKNLNKGIDEVIDDIYSNLSNEERDTLKKQTKKRIGLEDILEKQEEIRSLGDIPTTATSEDVSFQLPKDFKLDNVIKYTPDNFYNSIENLDNNQLITVKKALEKPLHGRTTKKTTDKINNNLDLLNFEINRRKKEVKNIDVNVIKGAFMNDVSKISLTEFKESDFNKFGDLIVNLLESGLNFKEIKTVLKDANTKIKNEKTRKFKNRLPKTVKTDDTIIARKNNTLKLLGKSDEILEQKLFRSKKQEKTKKTTKKEPTKETGVVIKESNIDI